MRFRVRDRNSCQFTYSHRYKTQMEQRTQEGEKQKEKGPNNGRESERLATLRACFRQWQVTSNTEQSHHGVEACCPSDQLPELNTRGSLPFLCPKSREQRPSSETVCERAALHGAQRWLRVGLATLLAGIAA